MLHIHLRIKTFYTIVFKDFQTLKTHLIMNLFQANKQLHRQVLKQPNKHIVERLQRKQLFSFLNVFETSQSFPSSLLLLALKELLSLCTPRVSAQLILLFFSLNCNMQIKPFSPPPLPLFTPLYRLGPEVVLFYFVT